jgi:ApbE superfamily uncharacterized protein (UPF0280 family)
MDLIVQAEGDALAVAAAHARAWVRFQGLLQELVRELPALRAPVQGAECPLQGPVARRMWHACHPFRRDFITPMAAVAGAVAQELLACFAVDGVRRAWVNNGGDIALHLAAGQAASVGVYADLAALDAVQLHHGLALDGSIRIASAMPVRGVATSGWRGRSHSLGIADSVTILAATAAQADAAATVVANAVNVADARIARRPACEVKDDSDLGDIPVTVDVPALPPALVRQALQAGLEKAQELQAGGHLWCALLSCQGQWRATPSAHLALEGAAQGKSAVPFEVGSVFA